MTTEEIRAMQRKVGAEDDGFWGRKSIAACQAHLMRMMPHPHPFPGQSQEALRKFYGEPGDESRLVRIEFPYPMFYDGKRVTHTRVNERCADSLVKILTNIGRSFGNRRDVMEEAEDYGGIFNYRPKRGGTSWSCHAYGAAIDLDADDNTFRDSWPMKADMPLEIIEEFARGGWLSAAAFWGYDAMHCQATR